MMGISNDYFSKEKEKQNKMSLDWTHKNNRICEIEREASFPPCVEAFSKSFPSFVCSFRTVHSPIVSSFVCFKWIISRPFVNLMAESL